MSAMSSDKDSGKPGSGDGEIVHLGRVAEKVKRRRADKRAEELATRFHRAMGWKGTPDKPEKNSKGKRSKKKR